MDKEYKLMTKAPRDVIKKSLKEKGYNELQVESWDFPLFRDNFLIGIRLEKVNEDNFDLYQAKREGEEGFINNPEFFLYSDIENSLMEIDEEFLMEEGKLEKPLDDRKTIEKRVKGDFMNITNCLKNSGYKTDFYEIEEGFDI
jgi:hypothetical protein